MMTGDASRPLETRGRGKDIGPIKYLNGACDDMGGRGDGEQGLDALIGPDR